MTTEHTPEFERNRADMSRAIAESTAGGETSFMAWFNQTSSVEESFVRGAWDFSFYFVTPEVCALMEKPGEKCSLEIGYGGGRLLQAARQHFRHCYGADVHAFADTVRDLLRQQDPRPNVTLFTLQDETIPLPAGSIHYVYSTIVIQHFYSRHIFGRYLKEIARVLAPGGLAHLYFADLWKHHEKLCRKFPAGLWRGYLEEQVPPDARTAYNTLWMTRRYVQTLMEGEGFEVLGFSDSYKNVPDGYPERPGSQSGVLARKRP